jgi:hypothetical protein
VKMNWMEDGLAVGGLDGGGGASLYTPLLVVHVLSLPSSLRPSNSSTGTVRPGLHPSILGSPLAHCNQRVADWDIGTDFDISRLGLCQKGLHALVPSARLFTRIIIRTRVVESGVRVLKSSLKPAFCSASAPPTPQKRGFPGVSDPVVPRLVN